MTQKLEEKNRAGSRLANQENVTELKKGKSVLGELYPILVDDDGKIIDGHHRSSAGFKEKKVLKWVKTPRDKILARVWSNYRREVTESETRDAILQLAKSLEKDGIEKEHIASELAKLLPYSAQYVRRLLPEEYKHTEFKNKAKLVSPPVNVETTPTVLDKLETIEERPIAQRESPDAALVFEEAHAQPQKFDDVVKNLPPIRAAKPISYIYHIDVKSERVKVKVTIASGYSLPKEALEVEILA